MVRTLSLTLALVVASVAGAFAQETTTGSIGGQVLDAQGLPLPGVSVTVSSAQGTSTFTTDDQGRFFAPFLSPGVYTVRAELAGFQPAEQKADVRLGQRSGIDLRLSVAGVTESVTVSAQGSVVDVTDSSAQTNIDSQTLTRIPVQRRLSDTLYIAPGVSSGGGTGRANPSVSGASGLENQYIVDGVNITNPGYGALGSYSIVLGSLGTGVTFDFIQEVQVLTAGFEAQYGQSTGGVVNVVTKTGSNDVKGTVFSYFQPSAAQGNFRQVQTTAATRVEAVNLTGTTLNDVGVEVSGPVLRDKMFFFAAIDPQWERQDFIAPEEFPLRGAGDQTRERNIVAYSGKLTWQATQGHRFNASFFGDPGRGPNGPQRRSSLLRTDLSGFSQIEDFGGHNQTIRYDGVVKPTWLVEASVARATNQVNEVPSSNTYAITDRTTEPTIRSGGIGFFENNDGETVQLTLMGTNFVERGGSHQLRYGVEWQDINYDNITNYSGEPFTLSNGQQTVTGATIDILPDPTLGQIYRVTRSNLANVRATKQQYTSFFIQDTWRLGERLTIRPGVRYEQQRLEGNLQDFTFDQNWGPRIGVTYDPTGAGRMKAYGNWGRFYAKIPNDLAARALSADAGITRADYFDVGLTQPIPEGVEAAGTGRHLILAGLSASTFDDTAKSTYHDETLVGFEWEAFPGISVDLRYTHRNFGRVLEDVGTAPMVAYYELPASTLSSVEYFITNPDAQTPVTFGELFGSNIAFEEAIHDYDAFEVSVNRRFSNNWSLQTSYRWSRLEGTFEGFFRNDNGQSDPAITSLFDFPTNDPSYATLGAQAHGFRGDIRFLGAAGAGPLPNDRRHQWKAYGNYLFNFGLNVGLGINVGSGRPLTALAANPVYESPGEIPEGPRGSGFQTDDGFRTRTPATTEVDLHGDYGFRLGGTRLVVLADVFNLFNQRPVLEYDDYTESTFSVLNPDFGQRIAFQNPITFRFGARYEF